MASGSSGLDTPSPASESPLKIKRKQDKTSLYTINLSLHTKEHLPLNDTGGNLLAKRNIFSTAGGKEKRGKITNFWCAVSIRQHG
jgi:hypothetical protein